MDATLQGFHSTGYLRQTDSIGRLMMREIITASPQLVPFLRAYERWLQEAPLSLAEAVDHFFAIY